MKSASGLAHPEATSSLSQTPWRRVPAHPASGRLFLAADHRAASMLQWKSD